jgi:hypothetical protein
MRREDIGAESSATTPPLDDHALRETAPQAVRGEAHLPSLEAAGWRIKRVHERVAKTAG